MVVALFPMISLCSFRSIQVLYGVVSHRFHLVYFVRLFEVHKKILRDERIKRRLEGVEVDSLLQEFVWQKVDKVLYVPSILMLT